MMDTAPVKSLAPMGTHETFKVLPTNTLSVPGEGAARDSVPTVVDQ